MTQAIDQLSGSDMQAKIRYRIAKQRILASTKEIGTPILISYGLMLQNEKEICRYGHEEKVRTLQGV
jgi:hypothetical protein